MINLNTALFHHFLDLTVAKRIRHIPTHAPQDDIPLKMASFERDRHHPPRKTSGLIIYPTAARRKFATEPGKMRLKPTQFRCRPAMRWPVDAGLVPATRATAKAGKPYRDLAEQRGDHMV
jgi:hypothetical protein